MLEIAPIMIAFCSLPLLLSYFSKNTPAKLLNSSAENNIDKTNDWGHFSTGVVIADAKVDVTTQTFYVHADAHMIWLPKCTYQG